MAKLIFNAPVGSATVFEGPLTLNQQSSGVDLAANLASIRADVAKLTELSVEQRRMVEQAIDKATAEAKADKPRGNLVGENLEQAAKAIANVSNATENTMKLAGLLATVGKLALTILA